ncbi:MAG: TetR/AcrR family transcriptional regulator [Solimonas sp.]
MSTAAPRARKKAESPADTVKAAKPNLREQQKEATRAAILQAALQIFSEHGFNGTSTRDIAARAGVHHALIKYYYQSKDLLWRAAVSYLFERQSKELWFDPPSGPRTRAQRREEARQALRRYVLYCARHPEHARLMVQESVRDSERLQWASDHFIGRASHAAEAFVRRLQDDDLLPIASAPALVYIIVGAAQSFYTLAPEVRRIWKMDPSDDKVMNAHIDALLAVFIR